MYGVNVSTLLHLTTCVSIASANLFNFYSIISLRFAIVFNFTFRAMSQPDNETFLLRYTLLLFTFVFYIDLFVFFRV